ncbi:MAG: hypothetical protein AB8C84_09675 [Oligoflexales bacterium]
MNRFYDCVILLGLWSAASQISAQHSQALDWKNSLKTSLLGHSEQKYSVQLDTEPSSQTQEMFDAWASLYLLEPMVWDGTSVSVSSTQKGAQFIKKVLPYFAVLDRVENWAKDWKLYPEGDPRREAVDYERMAQRLNVSVRALESIASKIPLNAWIPLGAWHNIPWYHSLKKEELLSLTRDYVMGLSQKRIMSHEEIQIFLNQWILASGIDRDFEFHLHPWPEVAIDEFIRHPLSGGNDVNRIHMGIEYTTQYPFQDQPHFENKTWTAHGAHYDSESRSYVIGQLANQLAKEFGPRGSVAKVETSGHGHGLGVVYQVKESENKVWRVEWDGILRSYDPESLIRGSERKGHIEVVTPKMVVTADVLKKVFKTFSKMDSHPRRENGGGHVNVDLAPFEGRPDAMVRWLQVFHKWRGTLSLLFQHPVRIPAAQPVSLFKEDRFVQKMSAWNGSELSLKRTLYQHRYFNRRMNRKPRYVQMDLSYYFQDIIKGKFYKPDFDVKSPSEVWRAQFRLEPDVRKMELRMMDAPRHEFESALQIRVVRAMLDYALNQRSELSGGHHMQKVDYVGALEDVQHELNQLRQMAHELHLPYDLLEWKMYDSLFTVNQETPQKLNYKKKLKRLYPLTENKIWGEAHKTNISRESLWQRLESQFIKSKKDKRANQKQKQRASLAQQASEHRSLVRHQSEVLFLKLGYVTPLHQLMQRWACWPGAWSTPVVRSAVRLLSKFESAFLARGLRGWFVEALNDVVQVKSQGLKARSEIKYLRSLVESMEEGWIDAQDPVYQSFKYECANS